jgi:hypothetical protein
LRRQKSQRRISVDDKGTSVTKQPAQQRIKNALEVLESVRHAMEDFKNAPSESRAKTAVRNFLEQGRSVTWALHHLKSNFPPEIAGLERSNIFADQRRNKKSG